MFKSSVISSLFQHTMSEKKYDRKIVAARKKSQMEEYKKGKTNKRNNKKAKTKKVNEEISM